MSCRELYQLQALWELERKNRPTSCYTCNTHTQTHTCSFVYGIHSVFIENIPTHNLGSFTLEQTAQSWSALPFGDLPYGPNSPLDRPHLLHITALKKVNRSRVGKSGGRCFSRPWFRIVAQNPKCHGQCLDRLQWKAHGSDQITLGFWEIFAIDQRQPPDQTSQIHPKSLFFPPLFHNK